jgi:hypothetical protein
MEEHNQVKVALMNEIKSLRKALSPHSEQAFLDLQKSETARRKQEEDMINAHIERDRVKVSQ